MPWQTALSRAHGAEVPTIAVDSMQVYREIPAITNQARRRLAELIGIVPVTEEWTVAGIGRPRGRLSRERSLPSC